MATDMDLGNGHLVIKIIILLIESESYEGMYNNDKKQGEGVYRWKFSK